MLDADERAFSCGWSRNGEEFGGGVAPQDFQILPKELRAFCPRPHRAEFDRSTVGMKKTKGGLAGRPKKKRQQADAETGRDQREHGLERRGGLRGETWRETGEPAHLRDVGAIAVGVVTVEPDPRVLAQITDAHTPAVGQAMARSDHEAHLRAQQGEGVEIAARHEFVAEQEPDVRPPGVQGRQLLGKVEFLQDDLDARVAAAKLSDTLRDQVDGEAPVVADDELTGGAAAGVLHGLNSDVDLGEDFGDVFVEASAGVGQLDAHPIAVEKTDAELSLEVADLPAERRLGDAQLLRRPAKIQVLGDGVKVTQVAKLHVRRLSSARVGPTTQSTQTREFAD